MYTVKPYNAGGSVPYNVLAKKPSAAGIVFHSWHGGCGLGWLQGFGVFGPYGEKLGTFEERADWATALYKALYAPGNVIYSLASSSRMSGKQLDNPAHQLLVEVGSRQIAEFPNLYHGPSAISVWQVNVRDIVGMYCNVYGEPYNTIEERNLSDRPVVVLNDEGGIIAHDYASLPKRTPA